MSRATTAARKRAAHALLDAAKRGEPVTAAQIVDALKVTGDLDVDHQLQMRTPSGAWEKQHAGLAARASWLDPIH